MCVTGLIIVEFEKFKGSLKVGICIFNGRGTRYEKHGAMFKINGEELNFVFQNLNEHSSINNGLI